MDSSQDLVRFLENTFNPSQELNDVYLSLAQALVQVDEEGEFVFDFHFVTEVVYKRYPNGLPCSAAVSTIVKPRIALRTEERRQGPPNEKAQDSYRHYSKIIKCMIWEMDQTFATKQANFFAQCTTEYAKCGEALQKMVKEYYGQIKELSNGRFPTELTINEKGRRDLEKVIQDADFAQLNGRFRSWGAGP